MKKILVFTLVFLFMFSISAFALLEVPNEESLVKIEEALMEYVGADLVIESAWFIDFPSVTDERFIQVIALLDGGRQEQTFYLNSVTFEVVNEDVILAYQQEEADSDEPVFRITTKSADEDEDDETDFVRAPEGSEMGIVSIGQEPSNSRSFLAWGIPSGLFVVALGAYIIKKKK